MKMTHWLVIWIIAFAVNASALSFIFLPGQSPAAIDGDAADNGEMGLEVGLGMLGSYADVSERLAPPKAVIEPPATAEPVKTPAPKIEPAVVVSTAENTLAIIEQEPEQPSIEKPKSIEKEKSDTATTAVEKTNTAISSEKNQTDNNSQKPAAAAIRKATGLAEQQRAGGKKGNGKNYHDELMRWLRQHNQYPINAKKQKQQGTVQLQFVIDRNGVVKEKSIYKSSGYPLLDAAALEMLERATPVPSVPDSFYPGRNELPLVIPIEYSLITNSF